MWEWCAQLSVVLYLGSRPEQAVSFGVSALAELTALLHALSEPGHHPAQRKRLTEIRDRVPDALTAELSRWSCLWGTYRARLLFPGPLGLGVALGRELDAIASIPGEEFDMLAAWGLSGGYTGRDFSALRRHPAAAAELLRRTRARGGCAAELASELLADRERFRDQLLQLLRKADAELLGDNWAVQEATLSAEARIQRFQMVRLGVAPALQALSPATSRGRDPDRLVFDMLHPGQINLDGQALLVMASDFIAPHVLIKHEAGWPAIFQYPRHPAGHRLGRADMQRRLAVLASPGHLALARMLAAEALPTIEIARRTGRSPAHVSRQLRTFRQVGLVEAVRDGNLVYYRLTLSEVSRLGIDLLETILR
jgi:DNA-binding transcriptional ArsR family regulator